MGELTERYVGATLRSIPEKQRADIEAELRASIGDEIDARVESGEDEGSAEQEVLTALGDPDRLAADYSGQPSYLIGPEHFFDYKRLVSVLLITVVPIVMAVMAVVEVIGSGDVGDMFGAAFGAGLAVAVHIVFWTTLVFALIERSGEKVPTGEWTPDRLPARHGGGEVKLSETIAALVFLVLAINVLLLSRTVSPFTADDGSLIPIFDPTVWDFWFPFLIGVLAVEIGFEVVKYRVGRWTWPLASFNLALNALFAIPAVYLLATDQLFNPEFVAEMPRQVLDSDLIILVLIVLAVSWDIVDGFRKARKAR
ncbi:MAG TPA: permease prefix domain 1-containing protein [Acidimicrobiia bacterium]|nr:permease prefix domain 1-containing protein [Acidimicrobiia bacterium]